VVTSEIKLKQYILFQFYFSFISDVTTALVVLWRLRSCVMSVCDKLVMITWYNVLWIHGVGFVDIYVDLWHWEQVRWVSVLCVDTALHVATRCGHVEMVDLLVNHGALINASEYQHRLTALHMAAQNGHHAIIVCNIRSTSSGSCSSSSSCCCCQRYREFKGGIFFETQCRFWHYMIRDRRRAHLSQFFWKTDRIPLLLVDLCNIVWPSQQQLS